MKITKSCITYTIENTLENGWEFRGEMVDHFDSISINIRAYINTPEETKEIGYYGYSFLEENSSMNANYAVFDKSYEEDFVTTCKELINAALAAKE